MGNKCLGSRKSCKGCFQSLPNPFWWCRLRRNLIPKKKDRGISKESQSGNPTSSHPVHHRAPQQANIVNEETRTVTPQPRTVQAESRPLQLEQDPKLLEPRKPAEEIRIPEPIKQKEERTSTTGEDTTPSEQAKPKKPPNFKRIASAGLQIDSVLQRKTGRLKDDYTIGRKLGHGQFGTTYLCVEKSTSKEYACKSIAKRKLRTIEDVEDVRREIQIMHHVSGSTNVVEIKGAYEDNVAVHLVMELCEGGELFDRIVQRGHYTERKAADLVRTIVGVIESCHSLGVMHRDLKPENFLFVKKDEDSPLKAIDFGLSIFFKPGDIQTDIVGSPYYVAPEVLRRKYGSEVDVWSAGVIIYILLCGVPPFWAETEREIFDQVLNGNLDMKSQPWPSISDGAKDLVKRMLTRDPKKRITAYEVLCHPWVHVDGTAPDRPLDPAVSTRLKQFSVMDKLKKMALRVIAENLSEEEIAGLKEMFKMIDTDNSGQISFQELKDGLKKFGADLNETEIHDLMQAADVDNSGTIDYGEFIAATLHLNKIDKEDHLFAAFSYFDKDGSGYITPDELQKACKEFGIEDIGLEDIIKEVDQDNDGRIDYNEFASMMQNSNPCLGKKGIQNSSFRFGCGEKLSMC